MIGKRKVLEIEVKLGENCIKDSFIYFFFEENPFKILQNSINNTQKSTWSLECQSCCLRCLLFIMNLFHCSKIITIFTKKSTQPPLKIEHTKMGSKNKLFFVWEQKFHFPWKMQTSLKHYIFIWCHNTTVTVGKL